jgi:amino acid transporter
VSERASGPSFGGPGSSFAEGHLMRPGMLLGLVGYMYFFFFIIITTSTTSTTSSSTSSLPPATLLYLSDLRQ